MVELLNKLSTTVFFTVKRLMHFQILLNIYKFADSTTFRFVLRSVHQVKGDFILILALASNHLSVAVCVSMGVENPKLRNYNLAVALKRCPLLNGA